MTPWPFGSSPEGFLRGAVLSAEQDCACALLPVNSCYPPGMTVTAALLAVALASGVTSLAAWLERRREVQHRQRLIDSLGRMKELVMSNEQSG